ncbi:histidine kinase [Mangrovivirga sp. M17]|uniref:Histidine kinase n=1 Tax=Mangrovivirga halotolerans TaxID=2993936 RepID=A0ABT3RX07_9BACT|nr:histidine kinase [Mangrovivirga halotolerans]MCX2746112.1 histidine kinase [Mangrovivirga halotolerans]
MLFNNKYRWGIITLISVYSFLNIKFTVGEEIFDFKSPSLYLLIVLAVQVIFVWEGNRYLNKIFKNESINTIQKLGYYFLISLPLVIVISLFATYVSTLILNVSEMRFWNNLKLDLAFVFRVNLFLHTINAIVIYAHKASKMKQEKNKLEKEMLEVQFDALRNQLNPHFLFNNLNALSSLISTSPVRAESFVRKLSLIFRYLLQHNSKELVTIKEELDFIKNYLDLYKYRYGDALTYEILVDDKLKDQLIIPSVTQLICENIFKYNSFTRQNPIEIKITLKNNDNNYLEIWNTRNPKTISPSESNGVGFKNIINRYKSFSNKRIESLNNDSSFSVMLPIIPTNSGNELFNNRG